MHSMQLLSTGKRGGVREGGDAMHKPVSRPLREFWHRIEDGLLGWLRSRIEPLTALLSYAYLEKKKGIFAYIPRNAAILSSLVCNALKWTTLSRTQCPLQRQIVENST